MNPKAWLFVCLTAPALFAVVHCGGSNSSPTSSPTPVPTIAPTPEPTLAPLVCDPTPPPLRYVGVKVHHNSGYRKILDCRPIVQNVDKYCQRIGAPGGRFCSTRVEGDPQRADCDRMAMGMSDTGRYGPTWRYEGKPCRDSGPDPGCYHHSTNQFLVIAKGIGEFSACAAADAPVDEEEGARCGFIKIESTDPP
jgi:hypothetical protein